MKVHVAVIDWDLGPSVTINTTYEGLLHSLAINADRMNGWREGTTKADLQNVVEVYGDQTITILVAEVEDGVVPVKQDQPGALDYPPGYVRQIDRLAETDPDGGTRP